MYRPFSAGRAAVYIRAHGENGKIEAIPADRRRRGERRYPVLKRRLHIAPRGGAFLAAPITVACHFPHGYFSSHPFRPSRWLSTACPSPPPHLPRPRTCTYAPRRVDYSSSPIPPERATYRNRVESSVHEARSIILDHAYRGSPPLILPLPISRGRSPVIHAISIHPARDLLLARREPREAG